jgi:hypothetical protein
MGAFIAMGRRVVKSTNICFFIIRASLSSMQREASFALEQYPFKP